MEPNTKIWMEPNTNVLAMSGLNPGRHNNTNAEDVYEYVFFHQHQKAADCSSRVLK